MKQLAGIMVSWLIRHEAIEKNQRELYEYAVHCLFLEMMPMLYAVIIGGIMGELSRSMVLVLPFMIIRKYSGGFHARSEWTCLLSSCLCYIVVLEQQYMCIIAYGLILVSALQLFGW